MNQTEDLLRAIETLRPELPALIGAGWPAFEKQLDEYLRRLAVTSDPVERAVTPALIVRLFEEYPRARARLAGLMGEAPPATRGFETGGAKGLEFTEPAPAPPPPPGPESAGPPAPVVRYTDIACPRRVWIETPRITVVVRLTMERPEFSAAVEALTVQEGVPVQVRVQTDGFLVLGDARGETPVLPDRDSPPLAFDLRPLRVGHTTIAFDFFQGGQPLRTATVPVEITPFEVVEGAEPRPAGALHLAPDLAPPDMVLHIAWQPSPPALEFTLIRDGGAWWRTFAPVPLEGDPATHAGSLYRRIATLVDHDDPALKAVLGKRQAIPAEGADRRIRQLGQGLWRDVVPAELRALYAAERPGWQDRTLMILSDEPHLPWELVWPYEPGGYEEDGPWCSSLRMTRWLRRDSRGNGNETPPGRLALRALAVLAPSYSLLPDLKAAQIELEIMRDLVSQYSLRDVSPPQPSWEAVMDLLEGGDYDWFHAAAHGNFYAEAPEGDSALWLQRDVSLTPDAIVGGAIEGHLKRDHPGFFFNACQAGRQGWALTRLGGWANRLVSSGAGLFVGPLWEVSDGGALDFARVFYGALFSGDTVAESARQGREAARRAGDPTWLAYSVYGHPNARVVL